MRFWLGLWIVLCACVVIVYAWPDRWVVACGLVLLSSGATMTALSGEEKPK
jgi:hypothetical protein